MGYTKKQTDYINSVEGKAHITAVEIIGELERQHEEDVKKIIDLEIKLGGIEAVDIANGEGGAAYRANEGESDNPYGGEDELWEAWNAGYDSTKWTAKIRADFTASESRAETLVEENAELKAALKRIQEEAHEAIETERYYETTLVEVKRITAAALEGKRKAEGKSNEALQGKGNP